MKARLSALWPHHPLLLAGAGGLIIALVALDAVTADEPNALLTFATTASWLVAGVLLGWHLKTLHRWPAAPLIPQFLVTHAVGHLLLIAGLWLAWWLILRPPAPTALLSLMAAGLGVGWPFIPSAVGLGGSVLLLGAAFSTTVQQWLGSHSANLVVAGFSVLVLLAVLVQITRVEQPAAQKPLRWFWLGVLFNREKPPKPVAESLARALRIGARQSWILAGIILVITTLIALITFIRPETRPSLLAMLFPAWMGGILTMPILVHLNSVRSLDRLWLTGAFTNRRSFAEAVVTANINHIQRMNLTAMVLLLGLLFVDVDVGVDGLSLLVLLFGASVALLALTVWTTQNHSRRLPIAIFVAVTIVLAMLASYAILVNDLLFDDPVSQLMVCVGISIAAQVVGVRWAGYRLSQQSFSISASAHQRSRATST